MVRVDSPHQGKQTIERVVRPIYLRQINVRQINDARAFRRSLRRGLEQVRAERPLMCAAHNVLKLAVRHVALGITRCTAAVRPAT